jgi:hypothetical protein
MPVGTDVGVPLDRVDAGRQPPRDLDLPDRTAVVLERDERAVERALGDASDLGLVVGEGVTAGAHRHRFGRRTCGPTG